MTDSLFSEEPKQPETPAPSSNDPLADLLSGIRNENGEQKYRDVETALAALKSSQAFIEQLKREKREIEDKFTQTKADLERMGTIDDYVKRLQTNPAATEPPKETPKGEGSLSEEQVARMLDQRLTEREQRSMELANLQRVEAELKQAHGDNAVAFIRQKAQELGMTVPDLQAIAKRTPAAALQLLGAAPGKPNAPSQSSMYPPRKVDDDNPMPQFEKGVTAGGITSKELVDRWKSVGAYTHKRLKVNE